MVPDHSDHSRGGGGGAGTSHCFRTCPGSSSITAGQAALALHIESQGPIPNSPSFPAKATKSLILPQALPGLILELALLGLCYPDLHSGQENS